MRVLWVLGVVVVLLVVVGSSSSSFGGSVRGAEVPGAEHARTGREVLNHREEDPEIEAEPGTDPKVEFKFKRVDYQWKSKAQKQRFEKKGKYIPKNNVITGVKVYNSPEGDTKYFVTVPRWRTGVPATLNLLVKNKDYEESNHDDDEEEFILRPWPSWKLQKVGDPDAMQYVQSMEIDTVGNMWVIDAGRRNFLQPSKTVNGPPKLYIFDIESESLVRLFVFPNAVAPWSSSFLNDIVISPSGTSAFISDTGEGTVGGLIAYDFNLNQARRLEDKSTRVEKDASDFRINGHDYTFNNPSDGIALHPDGEQLFYCALTGYNLYRVSATLFGDFSVPIEQVRKTIELIGRKASQSDGMTFSNKGILYFGALQLNAVYHWDPSSGVKSNGELKDQKALIQSNKGVQWVDTFAFDNQRERIVFTSNRLQKYFFNQTDLNEVSMRIWSVDINAQSYQQGPSF